ncbi:VENN motif-containing pre-toxin protein, partial [Bibersteinia trehalosi]|uniref:VENN motif pre-toxin domain-containing protein n=1 Tax=Bibersteinia trehalosi TaxID=47735 RepID=UPI001051E54D
TANLLAHAALSALEAGVSGNNVGAGAVAGLVGEGSAMLLAETVFNKQPNELTAEERNLLKVAGQLAGAAAGQATGGSTSDTVFGAETAKRAVENNYLSHRDVYAYQKALKKAIENGESVEEVHKHFKALSEKQRNELLADCDIDCRVTVPQTLLGAVNLADDLSGALNSWLQGLPFEEQGKFYQLVESENQKTIQALKEKQTSLEKGIELAVDASRLLAKESDINTPKTKQSLYDSKKTREQIEGEFGEKNVKSTTVVNNARSTVTERTLKTGEKVQIIESEGGKAVQIRSKPDKFGNTKLLANIPYDSRGLPIFDDVAKFTTKIEKPKNYQNMSSEARKRTEMRNATLALKKEIESGRISKSLFTDKQLKDIYSGNIKIDKYTWHHNAQSSPNNMQLVPENIHNSIKHIGEATLSEGR